MYKKKLLIDLVPLFFLLLILQFYGFYFSIYPVDSYFHFKRAKEIKKDGFYGILFQTFTQELTPNPYPPLYHLTAAASITLFGLKITNAFFLIFSIILFYYITYFIGSRLYGRLVGLVAFMLGIYFTPFHEYLTVAMPSIPAIALSMLSIYYFSKKNNKLFIIISIISSYIHFLGFYFYISTLLINYKRIKKDHLLLIPFIAFLPWIFWILINGGMISSTLSQLVLNNNSIILLSLVIPSIFLKDEYNKKLLLIALTTTILLLLTGWYWPERIFFTFSIIFFILGARVITEILNIKRLSVINFTIILIILSLSLMSQNPLNPLYKQLRLLHERDLPIVSDGLFHATHIIGNHIKEVTNESDIIYAKSFYSEVINLISERKTCGDSFLTFWKTNETCNASIYFYSYNDKANLSGYRIIHAFGNYGLLAEKILN